MRGVCTVAMMTQLRDSLMQARVLFNAADRDSDGMVSTLEMRSLLAEEGHEEVSDDDSTMSSGSTRMRHTRDPEHPSVNHRRPHCRHSQRRTVIVAIEAD